MQLKTIIKLKKCSMHLILMAYNCLQWIRSEVHVIPSLEPLFSGYDLDLDFPPKRFHLTIMILEF